MPPHSGVSTANHQAQRWMPSIVALNPMVQRQNSAARSVAVPRSMICSSSRSPPKRLTARMVRAVHREQQGRAVEEGDRERVERVVEQVAVGEREQVGPVEMREDAVGHRLGPAAHQDRPDQAQHQDQPQRRGEGPADMLAHAQRLGPQVGADPPATAARSGRRTRRSGTRPPWSSGAKPQAVFRRRRLQRHPEQIPQEDRRVVAGLLPEAERR